jgi:hypothetical protein
MLCDRLPFEPYAYLRCFTERILGCPFAQAPFIALKQAIIQIGLDKTN